MKPYLIWASRQYYVRQMVVMKKVFDYQGVVRQPSGQSDLFKGNKMEHATLGSIPSADW